MCVASSPWTKKAIAVPSGDQVTFETRAPAGNWIGLRDPSAAEINWMPTLLRMVSVRERFALKSMNTPPSSWNGLENVFMTTAPSPISSMNHFLSGLALERLTFRCLGARTASATSAGGVTYPSFLMISSAHDDEFWRDCGAGDWAYRLNWHAARTRAGAHRANRFVIIPPDFAPAAVRCRRPVLCC